MLREYSQINFVIGNILWNVLIGAGLLHKNISQTLAATNFLSIGAVRKILSIRENFMGNIYLGQRSR